MASEDRFKKGVIATIAKRAANQCSNPDCGAITSGPTADPSGSVNVGQAAHIFGAHPGSARYEPEMVSADRGAITNAIWLCGNCHKLVDDDPNHYPAGLLFEWLKSHEQRISERVGKAGAELRRRYEQRHLEEFGKLSYLAERIIVEKGDLWEYRLTGEALRFELAPITRRWSALKRGLYMKPSRSIAKPDTIPWILNRLAESQRIAGAFGELINIEFARSWGPPGLSGDDIEIVATCRLFAELCASALEWEEAVRFVTVDGIFEPLRQLFVGVAGGMIDEAAKVPSFLVETVGNDPKSGKYQLSLTLSLPDRWTDDVEAALKLAATAIVAEISE